MAQNLPYSRTIHPELRNIPSALFQHHQDTSLKNLLNVYHSQETENSDHWSNLGEKKVRLKWHLRVVAHAAWQLSPEPNRYCGLFPWDAAFPELLLGLRWSTGTLHRSFIVLFSLQNKVKIVLQWKVALLLFIKQHLIHLVSVYLAWVALVLCKIITNRFLHLQPYS